MSKKKLKLTMSIAKQISNKKENSITVLVYTRIIASDGLTDIRTVVIDQLCSQKSINNQLRGLFIQPNKKLVAKFDKSNICLAINIFLMNKGFYPFFLVKSRKYPISREARNKNLFHCKKTDFLVVKCQFLIC